jgi:hypothetical protein
MYNKKTTSSGNSSSGQASTTSKGTMDRQRVNASMVQNVLLIWLDNSIDEDNNDCRNTITQLRRVMNTINMFTNCDRCIDFLTDINTVKVFMIISGELSPHIIPLIHDITQLDSIYIFCENKPRYVQWAKEWPKIKGAFTDILPICQALKEAAQQCEHNASGRCFMPTSSGASKTNLDQLDCSFMYTQILKEILLTIQVTQQHINDETPIWGYTSECYLYSMLNRVLRTIDVNIIIMMGFFVNDFYRQSQVLTVYRGQGLFKTDFDQLVKTKGGLMSFNNFLFTSKNRNISLSFARKAISNPDMVGILFVMTIDPSKSTTAFASIADVSYFKAEDEILFSMHTIFRTRDIKFTGGNNRLWQVEFTLTSDNDKDLRIVTERIREETFPDSEGWERFGRLLKGNFHCLPRMTKAKQRQYEDKIIFYEKSLDIYQKTLPPTHPDLTTLDNNTGNVYGKMDEHLKARSFYKRAVDIG